jgi:hypothetical protein
MDRASVEDNSESSKGVLLPGSGEEILQARTRDDFLEFLEEVNKGVLARTISEIAVFREHHVFEVPRWLLVPVADEALHERVGLGRLGFFRLRLLGSRRFSDSFRVLGSMAQKVGGLHGLTDFGRGRVGDESEGLGLISVSHGSKMSLTFIE